MSAANTACCSVVVPSGLDTAGPETGAVAACVGDAAMSTAPASAAMAARSTSDLREGAGAVAELLLRHADPLQQRQQQIRVRCVLWIGQVLVALDRAGTVADQRRR